MTYSVSLKTENYLHTEYKRLLRRPEERQAYADRVSSKFKEGDLILSVLWHPEHEFDPYINIDMIDRSQFLKMIDEYIASLLSELTIKGDVPEYEVVYESRIGVSDQVHIIMSCPEKAFDSNLYKNLWLNEKWDMVSGYYDDCLYGEISIEASGGATNIDGWAYYMFKPNISAVQILPGTQVPIKS